MSDIDELSSQIARKLLVLSKEKEGIIDIDNLSTKIAQKLDIGQSEREDIPGENNHNSNLSSFFSETETHFQCINCAKYSMSANVPQALKKYSKGNFGMFSKLTGRDDKRSQRMKEHLKNDLHLWCEEKLHEEKEKEEFERKRNYIAAEIITKNAAFALMTSGGAEEYMKLNEKDFIAFGDKYPTKNDGKEMFFEIRDVIFDRMRDKLKSKFKEIKFASFTLDKVTISR